MRVDESLRQIRLELGSDAMRMARSNLLDQVDDPVRQGHVQHHPGMQRLELSPQLRQVKDAEADRHRDAQRPDGFTTAGGDLGLGLVDAGQQVPAPCVENLAFLGE